MNIVQIMGRVGRDPETRFTQSGLKVTTFSLAVSVRKGGQEDTIWWRVTVWGDRFDKMMSYVKKGSALVVYGEMAKPTIYTDKESKPQVSMEMTADIIKFSPFGSPDGKSGQDTGASQSHGGSSGYSQGASQASSGNDPYGSDFGGSAPPYSQSTQSGTGQRYTASAPSDDQLPF